MPELVPKHIKSSRGITWHDPASPPTNRGSGWPPRPQTNDQERHITRRLFNSGGNGAIVSLATTPQRRHDIVTSSEGVRCSAGEFRCVARPHSFAACHDNFTAQRRECRAATIQTKLPRNCTPAASTSRVDAAGVLLAAFAFVFGLLLFVFHLLLYDSSPNHFSFYPRFAAVTY